MNIIKKLNGTSAILEIEGRLDTSSAPQLESEIKEIISGIDKLNLDFKKLDYVSSAGLRVILATQKIMNKQGMMTVLNVNDVIMEVFEVTGFVDILNIK